MNKITNKRLNKYIKIMKCDNEILLYDMTKGKLFVMDVQKWDSINSYLNNGNNLDKTLEHRMIEENIIVEESFDETGQCELLFNKMVYSKETLDITIIPTRDCNFKCVYCYEEHKQEYMQIDTVEAIINFYKKNVRFYKNLVVSWFGGEPLLNVDIIEKTMKKLTEISKENGVVFRSMITTNGYLLSKNVFERLVKVGIRNYQITIDGDVETHNIQRPHNYLKDSFQKIIANLSEIRESHKSERYEIAIRFNISKEMDEKRDKILEFYAEKFRGWKQLSFIFEWIRDWGGEIDKNIVTQPTICVEWYNLAKSKELRCFELYQNACGMYFCEACKLNGFIIDFDGSIHKCTLAMEDETYREVNKIGLLKKNGEIIFNNNVTRWLKKESRSACSECVYYPMCMGINCPLDTLIKKNQHCLPHKELVDKYIEALYLEKKYTNL